ncbi:SRPBCC family protein [Ornithinicoccus halotolerans]|uniref:SRPBCC family protein n=1 Tax=Ornithinicoccus halotolerans TaxID=1748220 RepID=UPI001294F044|nr:SRPBCC family protein [Ornithinicoccus halotolerans]
MTRPVPFPVPPEVAFDYLVDPARRPEWQSSLRDVRAVSDAPARAGTTWTDVTVVGVRPRMTLSRLDRPRRWEEVGAWHGVTAWLRLDFVAARDGCEVVPTYRVRARWGLGRLLTLVAGPAVRADLRRAARILGR